MDKRFCKTCECFVDLDELQIVTESNRIIVAFDKKRGLVHDLISAAATKTRLAKVGKVKGEVITVRKPEVPIPPAATITLPELVAAVKKPPLGKMYGTSRSELNDGFAMIDADDGLEYLVRVDSIIPDSLGRQFLLSGERVIFTPSSHFRKNIATEIRGLNRVEDVFTPKPEDWYDIIVEYVDERGYANGFIKGTGIKVFIASRVLTRQSGERDFQKTAIGDLVVARIQPTTEFGARVKFEALEAVVIEESETSRATLGDLYAQPGDEEQS